MFSSCLRTPPASGGVRSAKYGTVMLQFQVLWDDIGWDASGLEALREIPSDPEWGHRQRPALAKP